MPKCTLCNKEVYPAESMNRDGKIFHSRCFNLWKKQQQLEQKHKQEYYKTPEVRPQYFRVADPSTGKPEAMVAGVDDEENMKKINQEENEFLEKMHKMQETNGANPFH
ncbi:hypothetical protein EIN_024080 [Entamoeba invadens IP1]|uniref:hypothetical protein n=1 Tax=Entamoeba invadens IP1 TaxID=370355 RepID=UPI0002C3F84C|nr:hypothetical protein EIN_024080 [Entamoeba invadens IP1]ELP90699.1 hypothetical protein EIN_024080 [Entamoeba invadens IP1]|eukprot:XP_004257470.1 hypothetical protein EIN_024080 [Entamoeba invadens IP1]